MKLCQLLCVIAALVSFSFAQSQNPRPLLYQPLSPTSTQPGAPGFTLTVNGTGFVDGAVINWNGSPRATTFVSTSQVQAAIPAADVAAPGTAAVTVVNPAPGGGLSNIVLFPITFPYTTITAVQTDYSANSDEMGDVAIADFNGDGIQDLAFADPCGTSYPCPNNGWVTVLLGNSNGTFQSPLTIPAGSVTLGLITADFNGDGKADLAVINSCGTNGYNCGNLPGNVTIFLGNGDGTFTIGNSYTLGVDPYRGITADFNGDGKLDLAITNNGDGTVSILLGNGDGTFAAPVAYSAATNQLSVGIVAGDFNQDGKLDLAVTSTHYPSGPDALDILLGNGDGTFQAPLGSAAGENFLSPAVADFNGDGILDLAVPAALDNTVEIFLGQGDGTFQSPVSFASQGAPSQVLVTDFNGDGILDMVVGSDNTGNVSVILGNGGVSFQPPVLLPSDFRPIYLALGDFNNDGRIDIATANENSSSTTVLLQATVGLSKANLVFPLTLVGASSSPQTFTLTNNGNSTLSFSGVSTSGSNPSDFLPTSNCPATLAIGASCNITVTFKPTGIYGRFASLLISDSGAGSPQIVALSGTGTQIKAAPAILRFGSVIVGQTGGPLKARLTNTGTSSANIKSLAITGTDAADFAESNTCGSSIRAGASCSISVTFAPTTTGVLKAFVSVRTQNGQAEVELLGVGK